MNHQDSKDTKERTRRNPALLCVFAVLVGPGLFGCKGTAESDIEPPSDGAGRKGPRVYVADWANHRLVQMSDMRGTGWTTLGDSAASQHAFRFPVGICLDSTGRIYVTEQYHHRIVQMDDMLG